MIFLHSWKIVYTDRSLVSAVCASNRSRQALELGETASKIDDGIEKAEDIGKTSKGAQCASW
jgi:hypothetical protein